MRFSPKRSLSILLLLIAAALFSCFAVSNRAPVAVSFLPLPYQLELPLFVLVLLSIFFGAGVATLFSGFSLLRHKIERLGNRRKIAALENEVGGLRIERETILPVRHDAN